LPRELPPVCASSSVPPALVPTSLEFTGPELTRNAPSWALADAIPRCSNPNSPIATTSSRSGAQRFLLSRITHSASQNLAVSIKRRPPMFSLSDYRNCGNAGGHGCTTLDRVGVASIARRAYESTGAHTCVFPSTGRHQRIRGVFSRQSFSGDGAIL